jgi:hypothetical protein
MSAKAAPWYDDFCLSAATLKGSGVTRINAASAAQARLANTFSVGDVFRLLSSQDFIPGWNSRTPTALKAESCTQRMGFRAEWIALAENR